MPVPIARFISIIFQPLLLSCYGVFMIMNTDTWIAFTTLPQLRNALYLVILISTFLLPALTILMFLQRGTIESVEMRERRERNWPYIATLVFYIAGWFLLNKLPLPRVFSTMVMGAALAIFIAFMVNLRWKISIHMMGLGGMAGMLFALGMLYQFDLSMPLVMVAVAAGLTGTARLILNAHTPAQVYVGFVTGFFAEWVFVYIYNLAPYYFQS